MIIPARAGSKGVFMKNIHSLAGLPLIAHSIRAGKEADCIGQIFVSTDGIKIANIARQYGARIIERPTEIADDFAASEDAVLHALDTIEKEGETLPDYVFFVQCTSPLTKGEDFDQAITMMQEDNYDCIFAAKTFKGFIWRANANRTMQSINHDHTSRRLMRQERQKEYQETGAFYLLKTEKFRAEKKRFFGKIGVFEICEGRAFDIDTLDDFRKVEYLMSKSK